MVNKAEVMKYISPNIRFYLEKMDNSIWDKIEEIKLSPKKPVIIFTFDGWYFIKKDSKLSKDINGAVFADKSDIEKSMILITESSIYAAVSKIRNGYITIYGGHRVGIVGTAVVEDGIKFIKDISSMNFRIKRQIKGASDAIISSVFDGEYVKNTLIISPPRCGKTTIIRDIAKKLGDGQFKVGVVDERSEIAAMYDGVSQNDVGLKTDVLDNCPKSIGMTMLIRSMSPDVIITDEMALESDFEAMKMALSSGVKVITTVHGYDFDDVKRKPVIKKYLNLFETVVVLSRRNGPGTVEKIIRCDEM